MPVTSPSPHNPPTPALRPLWRDLMACAQLVGAVQDGASLATALPQSAMRGQWDAAQRGAAQALSFTVLRHLGTARAALSALHPKAIHPPLLRDVLHTALVLLMPQASGHYAAHTVVNQAVEACKRTTALRHAAGFVNAVLRRFIARPDLLGTVCAASIEARWNHPPWWVETLQAAYPQHWEEMLAVAQRPPAMTLRVNTRRISRADYQVALAERGLHSVAPDDALLDQALILLQPVAVERLPGFESGWVSVQDAAAQYAAALLDVQADQRVLDACAAPGGKTAHLLERADCAVLALDKDAQRLRRVDDTLRRLGLRANTQAADAAQPDGWWDGQRFDRILLDAPCSASGISRRHPDIRWLRRAADIPALAATQTALLDALWPLLQPGGKLLYATCSVFPQEGAEQATAFLARHADAIASPAPGQLLPQEPQHRGTGGSAPPRAPHSQDGFFYALFTKSS
ncbi:MAG: 16S rRNA (cytosine(967)-C(5))-methyltransferase RsmB [Thiomonas sp.]